MGRTTHSDYVFGAGDSGRRRGVCVEPDGAGSTGDRCVCSCPSDRPVPLASVRTGPASVPPRLVIRAAAAGIEVELGAGGGLPKQTHSSPFSSCSTSAPGSSNRERSTPSCHCTRFAPSTRDIHPVSQELPASRADLALAGRERVRVFRLAARRCCAAAHSRSWPWSAVILRAVSGWGSMAGLSPASDWLQRRIPSRHRTNLRPRQPIAHASHPPITHL